MFPNASAFEATQTLVAAIGFSFSAWGLWRMSQTALWLSRNQTRADGQRIFWMISRVRQELLRLLGQSALLAAGISSLFLPPPYYVSDDVSLQGQIRTWALLCVSIIFAIKTGLDLWDRERLENYRWDGVERRNDNS